MDPALPERLRQARELIHAGRSQNAQALLIDVVRANPNSEAAWVLLSQALDDPQKQVDCLQQVLRINPGNAEARARLASLTSPPPPPVESTPAPTPVTAPQPAEPPAPSPGTTPSKVFPFIYEAGDQDSTPPAPPTRPVEDHSPPARPAAAARAPQPFRAPSWAIPAMIVLLLLTVVGFAALGAYLVAQNNQAALQSSLRATGQAVAAIVTAYKAPTLPPTWTATPSPTITPTPTTTPTRTPTLTPTFPRPNATVLADMNLIQQEVSDLRGLTAQGEVQPFVIAKGLVRRKLESMFYTYGSDAELRDQARVLSALGLIKPTYDLLTYVLNGLADNIGGFYIPWTKELYVIGTRFAGIERFIYSHEFGHALVDQNFHIDSLGVYPECLGDAQRCEAIRALVEGDATLLMIQWWQQYATPQDYQDIFNYNPPPQTIPEQFPPPFVVRDADFPYEEGRRFVEYLFERGNWARVNQAYADLPQSTEHILHPEKYVAGEAPVIVAAPPLTDTLGAGWRQLESNVLGEWQTYLVLGYSADVAAALDDDTAAQAAAGWGGDSYQMHFNDATNESVLAVHWAWDTAGDAREFQAAMLDHQDERFRGAKRTDRTDGDCWEVNQQLSCVFSAGRETLWLLAPSEDLLDAVLRAYPGFP